MASIVREVADACDSDRHNLKPTNPNPFGAPLRKCCVCGLAKSRSQYSATQWKKSKFLSKCKACINKKSRVGLKRQNDHKKSLLSKTTEFVHSQSESVPKDFVVAQGRC